MKSGISRRAVLLLAALPFGACTGTGGPSPSNQMTGTVWQLSAFTLLQQGHYDGLMPVGAVRRHGDLGLGAADRLDGEMIVVDGRFYRFAENGRAEIPSELMMMPFAEVTPWTGGSDVPVPAGIGYDTLKSAVDSRLSTLDAFYAVRIEGAWDSVTARTYRLQTRRPNGTYPPLDSAAADTFTFRNVRGVMVGFRQPSYAPGMGVPNYHLHFIDADRRVGGHVISFRTTGVRVQVSDRPDYTVRMPPLPARP